MDAPTCSVTQPAAISGTQAVTSIITINTQAQTSTGGYTATVTGSSGGVAETATVGITITVPVPPPAFTLSGTPASIATPGMGATSTVTITPSGGFSGTVAITCAVTSGPVRGNDPPSCSASQPAAISGVAAVTSTLTISTTAASTATLHNPLKRNFVFGGGTLAALLFFCLPFRRRRWLTLLGVVAFSAIAAGSIGCTKGVPAKDPSNAGTTTGIYTFTVTGAGGSAVATTTVAVTVN